MDNGLSSMAFLCQTAYLEVKTTLHLSLFFLETLCDKIIQIARRKFNLFGGLKWL